MIPRLGTTALLLWSIGCTEYNVGPKAEPETGTDEPEETADTDAPTDTAESDTPEDTTDIEPDDTLAAYFRTVLNAAGVPEDRQEVRLPTGTLVSSVLA